MNLMYREELLDHYRYPRNFGTLASATVKQREFNPLCGDDITVQVAINDGAIKDVKFIGHGCAISIAAASMLTDEVKGKKIADLTFDKEFIMKLLKIPISPGRVQCATLALGALRQCMGGKQC